jgi:predicted dehydrogenase
MAGYRPRIEAVPSRTLGWGILGTAQIARKNWKAIQLTGNATVTAVASRDGDRSRRFIAECQAEAPMAVVPQAFGGYADLLACDAVDAVYIPLPTGLRREWVLRAAQAGKHVVCEKPCAVSAADLREMVEACRLHGVQFMDGVMFRHSRRLELLRQVLNDGPSVGEVRRIASAFTFRQSPEFFAENIRTQSALEPHGCLGDLGWYCLRFALWAQNWQMPLEVTGRLLSEHRRPDSQAAVPTAFSGELVFGGGVTAGFYCSFLTETEQYARISGTRGVLHISDFVLPFSGTEAGFEVHHTDFQVLGCDFRIADQPRRFAVAEYSHGHGSAQETQLFRNFSEQVLSGRLNPLWPEEALKTQIVMGACLHSARAGGRSVQPGH